MTVEERAALLDSFARGPALLSGELRCLPKRTWLSRPLPGRWSTHEIILHLADAEAVAYVECRQFIADPSAPIPIIDRSAWVANLGYFHQSTRAALESVRLLRRMTFELLSCVPAEIWPRTLGRPNHASIHSRTHGAVTLESWLQRQNRHIPHHLQQIKQNYEAWLHKNPPRQRAARSVETREPLPIGAD